MQNKKVSFPHMGDYHCVFKSLAELIGDPLVPPPITKKTIELGFKHSPESACIPFKYNLGNYIEALDAGANVIFQAGGGCRFGYYGEIQEYILRQMGYEFDLIKLSNNRNLFDIVGDFKKANPAKSRYEIVARIVLCLAKFFAIDQICDKIRKNAGFESKKGAIDAAYQKFLADVEKAESLPRVFAAKKQCLDDIAKIKINKPADCPRVGIIGEVYMLMEPFANFYLEKKMAERNIEVHRFVNVSGILKEYFVGRSHVKKYAQKARPYLKHPIGAHGTESVGRAHELAKAGFDGIIHLKPFGCMPEVSAMSALNNIAKDYRIPIMYFSFDSQTSEGGVATRIEAFCDMLFMKKDHKK